MQNTLVFGGTGQLGQCLTAVSSRKGFSSITFLSQEEADILDIVLLDNIFTKYKPDYVINCAAYTAVDKAEDEADLAREINKTGAKNLAEQCKMHNAKLIHISTDFVFKGNSPNLLSETDVAEPISVYGITKLAGEVAIAKELAEHYIIRTSWLYSEYANNFVKTMLKLGADRDELRIVADQIGSPTYAIDLADAILRIIESGNNAYGVYHYSNEGVASWYDLAKGAFDISGTNVKAYPIRTSEYPTRATRPAFSVMDKSKIKKTFNLDIPYWRDSLVVCIAAIQSS